MSLHIDRDPQSRVLRRTQPKQAVLIVPDKADLREQGGVYADRFFLIETHALTTHIMEMAIEDELVDREEFDFTRPENITREKFERLRELASQLVLGDFITPDDFAGGDYIEIDQAEAELQPFPGKLEQLLDAIYDLQEGKIPDAPLIMFEDGYTIQYLPNIGNGYIGNGDVVIEKKIRRTVRPNTLESELGGRKKTDLFLLRGLAAIVRSAHYAADRETWQQCQTLIEQLSLQLGLDPDDPQFGGLIYELKDIFNTSQLIHRIIRFKVLVENSVTATIGWLNQLVEELEQNDDAKRLMAVLGRPLIEQLVEQENFAGGPERVVIWEHPSSGQVEFTNQFVTNMLEVIEQNEGLRIAILLAALFPTDLRLEIQQGVKTEFDHESNRQVWAEFVNDNLDWGEAGESKTS